MSIKAVPIKAKGIAALFLIFFAAVAHAASDPAWLYQNLKNSDVTLQYSQGKIDGETYTAVVANRGNPKEELRPVIVIFSSRDLWRSLNSFNDRINTIGKKSPVRIRCVINKSKYKIAKLLV